MRRPVEHTCQLVQDPAIGRGRSPLPPARMRPSSTADVTCESFMIPDTTNHFSPRALAGPCPSRSLNEICVRARAGRPTHQHAGRAPRRRRHLVPTLTRHSNTAGAASRLAHPERLRLVKRDLHEHGHGYPAGAALGWRCDPAAALAAASAHTQATTPNESCSGRLHSNRDPQGSPVRESCAY